MKGTLKQDIEKCVRCGGCKALCPTYGQDLVESMSARGRMILLGGLIDGELDPSPLLNERIFSCLLCGMCETSCPVGVGITEAIYKGREKLRETDLKRRNLRRLLRFVLRRPLLSFRVAGLLRPLIPYLRGKGTLPFKLALPSEPLRKGLRLFRTKKAVGRVAMFTGCAVNFIYPHLGESLIRVLLKAGYEVVLPGGEVCCGAPLRAAGLEDEARRFAERNVVAFEKLQASAVLSLCPTCTLTLRKHYPSFVGRGIEKAQDVSDFLRDKINVSSVAGGITAAYHDPCHLRYGLGVRDTPRELLRSLGFSLIEPEESGCCGFSVSMTHPEISDGLLEARAREFKDAEILITACPGCMAQLSRVHKKVVHLIEALDADRD